MSARDKTPAQTDRSHLSRRTFLRGAGVAMALPWLESIPVWGDQAAAGGAEGAFPKRFATLFMACGVNPDHWWARGSGSAMELSKTLEPMAPFKTKMNVLTGLFNKNATGVGIHPGQTGNILSGAALQRGAELRGGVSMDQVLARHIGQESVQPCMVLGCEQPITGYHETNFSMAYSSYISWQNATSPVPMEVYPSLAFDSLFDNRGQQRNRSILDRVSDQAASLSGQVSAADRARLDEYLSSVREVEQRVAQARAAQETAAQRAQGRDRPVTMMPRPDNGLPEDIREHMRLMCDIVALGFQTDKTRVATLLLCRDISGLFYPFLNVRHFPPSRVPQRHVRQLRADLALLRQPTRLPRLPPGRHARRRWHGPGPFLLAVPVEHVLRQQARFQQTAGPPGRRSGRHARNRPRFGLHTPWRRQPQAVQHVPVDHGSDGC